LIATNGKADATWSDKLLVQRQSRSGELSAAIELLPGCTFFPEPPKNQFRLDP
jgi:hypothetical protein